MTRVAGSEIDVHGDGSGPTLICLPGGGMTRRYFDLDVPGYSMAAHLVARGCTVVTVDHPGVGDSDRPADGYTLTPRFVAGVNAQVTDWVRAKVVSGDGAVVGVGHSMGGLLAVWEQALHRSFDAVAVLGCSHLGLPDFISPEARAVGEHPERLDEELPGLVKAMFGRPEVEGSTSTSAMLLGEMVVPQEVLDAIGRTSTRLLGLCGLASMIPGASNPQFAAVDVPVFIGVGSNDITGDPASLPAGFPSSPDVTLFVLEGAGHNHNVAPNRLELWDALAEWCMRL